MPEKNIALLRSFEVVEESDSINIQSLRDPRMLSGTTRTLGQKNKNGAER